MQISIIAALTFATSAIAAPTEPTSRVPSDCTVGRASNTCGKDLSLSCCNSVDESGASTATAQGLLSGLLQGALQGGELGLFSGCSNIDVALVGDLLNSQCSQNVACCQDSGTQQSGLINVGLPCVALGSVL